MSKRYLGAEEEGCRLLLRLDRAPGGAALDAALASRHLAGLVAAPDVAAGLVERAHAAGKAVLVLDDDGRAWDADADGVLLMHGRDGVEEARRRLGADALIGVACGVSRHDAMLAGERGCDYVLFAGDADPLIDVVAWWSDLFELPCVVEPGDADLKLLARAGAHFLLLDDAARLAAADALLGTSP